ncbi:hypothetical protein [Streptomyces sp. MJP52]|uniref:hypothetical protein n=1 Tax=Streptomyces sp. MJP52 TaxID=2940555 RepID=UPI002475F7CE|nr:hypothetical protein [Streptomyces sp. MJP52]MDH6224300.1 hypothetical protein [Streptomyces sp. MJP52]
MSSVYVITIGAAPLAAATTLKAAQADALARETQYKRPGEHEYRWDEAGPGEVWRLMSRSTSRGGRMAWTQWAVHAVPLDAEAGEGQ